MTTLQAYKGGGRFEEVALDELTASLERVRSHLTRPFSAERLAVISDLSARLLASYPKHPALVYFAHWTRRNALREMAARFEATAAPDTLSAPRGVVLHFPPKNVETIFLFSWVIAYLTGNANIVRLPSDCSGAVMTAVDLLIERMSKDEDSAHIFVQYPTGDTINAALSRASDVRMVWGGNAKIVAFESVPLRNGGKSIWFGDRYSYAVISGKALANASANEASTLAQNLAVDILTFDQMGCSSPHKIYVVGNSDAHGAAIAEFLELVRIALKRHGAEIPTSHSIRKLTEAMVLAGSEQGAFIPRLSSDLVSVHFSQLRQTEDRVGGGFIVVEYISDLAQLMGLVRSNHQTLSYYGFDRTELTEFARTTTLIGLSRIVPIGQALNFDVIWDGYDLLRELTRTIRLN